MYDFTIAHGLYSECCKKDFESKFIVQHDLKTLLFANGEFVVYHKYPLLKVVRN